MSLLPDRPDITLEDVALRYRAARAEDRKKARQIVARHFVILEEDAKTLIDEVFKQDLAGEPLDWSPPGGKPDRTPPPSKRTRSIL